MMRLLTFLMCCSAACSQSGASHTGLDGGTDFSDPPDRISQACVERVAKLQAALDGARTSPAAAIGVASTDCPTTTLFSGADVTAGSLYRVGSITKTFVAATVLSLAHDSRLSLDDTLDKWALPVPNASGISVRHLLGHTSGLFNYTQDAAFGQMATTGVTATPEQLVAMATQHPPNFAPGKGWSYSNTNYILLGMIVKLVTAGDVATSMRTRAVAPAHLLATFFDGEESIVGTLASGFDTSGSDVTHAMDPSWAWTAGAEVASPSDLVDWVTALYGGDVLDATSRDAMSATPTSTGQTGVAYGFGTFVLSAALSGGFGMALGHGGDTLGYHAVAFYFPSRKLALSAVVNSDGANPNDLLLAAMSALK